MLKAVCKNWSLHNKIVFLRVDLNIDSINETFKFKKILPTLLFLQNAGARTIIGTHRGRPHGYDAWLSTEQLLPLFEQEQLSVQLVEGVHDFPDKMHALQTRSFLLLENLRFFQESEHLISALQEICDFYINDSWGSAHREDPFVDQLAQYFEPSKRSIGLLIEQEMLHLEPLKYAHGPKFTALIGGAKYAEKLAAIDTLSSRGGTILIGPAQSFLFHCARNENTHYFAHMGACTQELVLRAQHILQKTGSATSITLPVDYTLMQNATDDLSNDALNQLNTAHHIIGLGPLSTEKYVHVIQQSQTIMYAGYMGFLDNDQSMNINKTIFDAIAQINGTTIIAGGQTAQAAYDLGFAEKLSWISTGGGATLAYICNKLMPGLELFQNN